jgi:hypothetical protein
MLDSILNNPTITGLFLILLCYGLAQLTQLVCTIVTYYKAGKYAKYKKSE